MRLGLRVDVDTLRGTRHGLPRLLRTLERHRIRASIFASVGPDNMGRHLWRLLRPRFAAKMWRSGAATLYGWDILLRGTLWPGPEIGPRCREQLAAAVHAGHELGLHAWDHHRWQRRLDRMDRGAIREELARGVEMLATCAGATPTCSAAPGWICDERALLEKSAFPFRFNSDCRGSHIFRPRVGAELLDQPQIPTTLPTFDEMVGRTGLDAESWNPWVLAQLEPAGCNVLTIHAEVEGLAFAALFEDFLLRARAHGVEILPLGELLPELESLPEGALGRGSVPGREGALAVQLASTS
ncbi:MAG: 4-deoxy-4-formamido-L-arabinose-phosphoundecaprenol deformylase [Planctomycetes bacterium]|nr:4-deoxy-4-formamido-L-arabinose-phosphoundecaprenol deformylase [Planctomycetota bacterium]